MAERVCVPRRSLHAIPDAIDDLEAILIEPLAAAFRMVEQVDPQPGQSLAVLGDGKLGILCAWAARLTPAQVHLIGKHHDKLALAGDRIETHLLADAPTLAHRFDIVVDATGSPSGLPAAMQLVRPCGSIVLKTTIAARHETHLAPIVVDEIRVIGSRCGPFPRAIAALAQRELDVRPLIGAIFPLQDAVSAFHAAAQPGARKILLRVVDPATR
jgi:threonine dehydrogenase-like Zn-dependent dehydrogenase